MTLRSFWLVAALVLAAPAAAIPVPVMVPLSTGSVVASWTLPAAGDRHHATPVVFLHGGPGMYTEARRLDEGAAIRAAGFDTVYFDQAGGGLSGRLPAADYSLDRAVRDLEALRIALGKEQLVLWGNSWGADLALLYAERYPGRVAGVILTSPGMYPGYRGKRDYARTARDKVAYAPAVEAAIRLIDDKGAAAEATLPQDVAGKLFDQLVADELIGAMLCKGSQTATPALPGGANLYAQRRISADLAKAKVASAGPKLPALVVRGTCDFLPRESAERYQQRLGGGIVDIAGAGHGLIENRAAVDTAIGDFARAELANVP